MQRNRSAATGADDPTSTFGSKMIPIEKRQAQLAKLQDSLHELIKILENDPECPWLRHFRACYYRAQELSNGGVQDDLNSFSASVTSVYGGMGSFNDYVPPGKESNGRYIVDPKFKKLSKFSGRVYDYALRLRVVGIRKP